MQKQLVLNEVIVIISRKHAFETFSFDTDFRGLFASSRELYILLATVVCI